MIRKAIAYIKFLTIWNKIPITHIEFKNYLHRRNDKATYNGFRFVCDEYSAVRYYVEYHGGDEKVDIGHIDYNSKHKQTCLFLSADIREALDWYAKVKLSDKVKKAFQMFFDNAVYDCEEGQDVQGKKIREALRTLIE